MPWPRRSNATRRNSCRSSLSICLFQQRWLCDQPWTKRTGGPSGSPHSRTCSRNPPPPEALDLVEPRHLLLRPTGQELRREHTPEHGVGPTPADSHQRLSQRRLLAFLRRGGALQRAERVGATEHEVADALGVARRVGHREVAALREPEQREAAEAGFVDDGFELGEPRLERVLEGVSIGEATAALVVAHDRSR